MFNPFKMLITSQISVNKTYMQFVMFLTFMQLTCVNTMTLLLIIWELHKKENVRI